MVKSPVLVHIEKHLHILYLCGKLKGKLIDCLLIESTPAATTPADTHDATRIWPSYRIS